MCRGCKKQEEKDAAMRRSIEDAQAAKKLKEVEVKPSRLGINCHCGLFRMLPTGLNVDDTFALVPCPKCGYALRGKFVGEGVEEIL